MRTYQDLWPHCVETSVPISSPKLSNVRPGMMSDHLGIPGKFECVSGVMDNGSESVKWRSEFQLLSG